MSFRIGFLRDFTSLCFLLLLIFPGVLLAQQDTITIDQIELRGLRVWSPEDVNEVLDKEGLKEGESFTPEALNRRVNRVIDDLLEQGLFSDIQVHRQDGTLIFEFEEFNRVSKITFKGNKAYDDSKLKDVLLLQVGSPAKPSNLKQARRDLIDFYRNKGYSDVSVTLSKNVIDQDQTEVTFRLKEGSQSTINSVKFVHESPLTTVTKAYRNSNLKLFLPAKPGQPYSDQLKQRSVRTIKSWYSTLGYLDASVDVNLWKNLTEGGIDVEFHINDGPKYQLGKISVQGNQVFSDTEILEVIPLKGGDIFNPRRLTQGIDDVERQYRDRGYTESSVDFSIRRTRSDRLPIANVSLQVSEGQPVYVERIEIHGNFRTYDRVIRREIRLAPGELLDGEKKRNSLRRLRNLGFFSEVKMNVDPGSRENWRVVRVRVKEARTGQFQFGGGFSSSSGVVGTLSVQKDNFSLWDWSSGFTGRGQSIGVSVSAGERQDNFNVSWNDPWFNDDLDDTDGRQPQVPIGFGFNAFNLTNDFQQNFDQSRTGASLRASREFGPALSNSIDIGFSFSSTEISDLFSANFLSTNDEAALDFFREATLQGGDTESFDRTISSLELGIQRDRRDNRRRPTKGYNVRLSSRLAGEFLGGDANFINPELDAQYFLPSYGPTFWAFRLNYRTIKGFGSGPEGRVPSFEKFFLGRQKTVRGYEHRDIAVYRKDCNLPQGIKNALNLKGSGFKKCSGGNTAYYFNLEYRLKLVEKTMQTFVFTDFGNVYDDSFEIDTDVKQSAGIGLRVRTPMGPINISWAQRLDPTFPGADDDGETQVDFTVGTGF